MKLTYTRYKLVTQDYKSYGDTLWRTADGEWITVCARHRGNKLCSADVIHFYDHPLLAVLMNPAHVNIANPRLLKIRCSDPVAHDGTKGGCKEARAISELALPALTVRQRTEIAVRLAQLGLKLRAVKAPEWEQWAKEWLQNKADTWPSAYAAAEAAKGAAYAAAKRAEAGAYAAAKSAEAAACGDAEGAAHAAAYAAEATANKARSNLAQKYRRFMLALLKRVAQEKYDGSYDSQPTGV